MSRSPYLRAPWGGWVANCHTCVLTLLTSTGRHMYIDTATHRYEEAAGWHGMMVREEGDSWRRSGVVRWKMDVKEERNISVWSARRSKHDRPKQVHGGLACYDPDTLWQRRLQQAPLLGHASTWVTRHHCTSHSAALIVITTTQAMSRICVPWRMACPAAHRMHACWRPDHIGQRSDGR